MHFSFKTLITLLAVTATTTISAQTYRLPGQHSSEHKDLIAGQFNTKKQMSTDLSNYNIFGEEEEPEADIYTKGWESNKVNCYRESEVPQTHTIKLGRYAMPCPGYVTSPYGFRKKFNRMHRGVDLKINTGDTIYSTFNGRVRITNYEDNGYGNYIVIRHNNELETVYGHLSKTFVKPGQDVRVGQPIGLGGNTGRSTGPHLHFETRYMGYAINPAAIFDFPNQTVHTDVYTFDKRTYQNARDFSPAANQAYQKQYQEQRAAGNIKGAPKAKATKSTSTKKSASKSSSKATSQTTPAVAPANNAQATSDTVRKGDSLAQIASRNHTTVAALCSLNGLTTKSNITPGQTLKVR